MKLVSWNVNGLRACAGKGFLDSVALLGAEIVCVQETKMHRDQADICPDGFTGYWNSAEKKGYSGTATFTTAPVLGESHGMGLPDHDREGRVLALELDAFTLVNVYTPNSQRELARLDYRMEWDDAFRAYLKKLDRKKPVVVCGDLNVAHEEIDIKNAASNRRNAGFTDEERGKMTELLAAGFVDTFRALHPDAAGAYTWWSFRANARANNVGWRIDYFLVSSRLMDRVRGAAIHPSVAGSDHCPVSLDLDV